MTPLGTREVGSLLRVTQLVLAGARIEPRLNPEASAPFTTCFMVLTAYAGPCARAVELHCLEHREDMEAGSCPAEKPGPGSRKFSRERRGHPYGPQG